MELLKNFEPALLKEMYLKNLLSIQIRWGGWGKPNRNASLWGSPVRRYLK